MAETLEDRTMLTAFTVVNTDDAGTGSLRAAIEAANANAGADTISFDAALTGQTIVVTSELQITDDLIISGLGEDQLTIDCDHSSQLFRIFNIDDGSSDSFISVDINGLSLINGSIYQGGAILNKEILTVEGCILSENRSVSVSNSYESFGGAIYNVDAILNVFDSTLTNNSAGDSGGGIYNLNGVVNVSNSIFLENSSLSSTNYGGGINNQGGAVTILETNFSKNSAYDAGGGIANSYGDLEITNSFFLENSARSDGGGVYNTGSLLITNCTFGQNSASGPGTGGAIFSREHAIDAVTISGSTFIGNTANGGGGIFNEGRMLIESSTFSENSANDGGAIKTRYYLEIRNSAIHQNSTKSSNRFGRGGGIYNNLSISTLVLINTALTENRAFDGGAIYSAGSVTILNSTLSGNQARDPGDGFFLTSGGAIYTLTDILITNSTITGNSSTDSGGGIYTTNDDVILRNSILAGNTAPVHPQSDLKNLMNQSSIVQNDIEGLLDPVLRDNGGPTLTHALLPGSAAINAGSNVLAIDVGLSTDQRGVGFARVVDGIVDIGAFEVQVNHTQIDLRIVDSKTATDSGGEVDSLPQNLDWIDEWTGYWLEIWISTPTISDRGILSAAFDLSYNADVTAATLIEYGSAFSVNQTGAINDQSSVVENLSAQTSLEDLGADQHVLFARIRFESTAIDLDLERQSLSPKQPGFSIENPEVLFSDGTASDEIQGAYPTTQIWANPFDLNDDDAINFRDLIRFVTVYNQTPSQSASADAWFADFNQDDRVDFRDLILFASNYGRRKLGSVPVNYPDNYPDAWNQLLMVAATEPPQKPASSVTQSTVETVLEATVAELSPQLTSEQQATLSQVDIQVVDLAEGTLGRAAGGTIYIDINASGYGWFVDATPDENSEFSGGGDLTLIALPDSEAVGLIDLRTVILHELGHLLGYEHSSDGLMQETLAPGVRYLSDWESDTDEFFGSLTDDSELSVF